MYIESIEIFGFKTFVNNTKIILSKGVTCIVGPNGSGKSNIVDALRFLFGENKLSLLRASESSDLIFAGSSSRQPMNVASVKIIINNEDRTLPIKTPRVIIERRIVRDKESRYLVNGEDSSRENVFEIFRKANIFGINHAIVGQGRVEEILLAKPEEKKLMIDRVAGILDLKRKKESAEENLRTSEENLSKVSVFLNSIKDEYEKALRESQKVHIYYTLTSELKTNEEKLINYRIKKIKENISTLNIGLEEKRKEEEALLEKILVLKKDYEELYKVYKEKESKLEELNKKREEINLKNTTTSNQIDKINNFIDLKRSELTELNIRKEKLSRTKSYIEEDIKKIEENIERLQNDLTLTLANQTKLEARLKESLLKLSPLESEFEKFNKALQEKQQERVRIEKKISSLEKEVEFANLRINEIEKKLNILSNLKEFNIEALEKKIESLKAEIKEKEDLLKKLEEENAVLNFRIKTLKETIESYTIPSFKEGSLGYVLELDKNFFGLKDYLEGIIVSDVNEIKESNSKRFFVDLNFDFEEQQIEGLTPISNFFPNKVKFLNHIYLAKDLETALRIFRENFQKHYIREIITEDGYAVLSPYEVEKRSFLKLEESEEYNKLLEESKKNVETIQALRKEIAQLKETLENTQKELNLAKENEHKKEEKANLVSELKKEKELIENNTSQINKLKEELKEVMSKYVSFDDENLRNLRREVDLLKEEISKEKVKKREIELKIENLTKEKSDKERRIVSIENELKEIDNSINEIDINLEENQKRLKELIDELNKSQLDLKEVLSEIEAFKVGLKEEENKLKDISVEIEEANEMKESLRESIQKIELNIAKEEANLENLMEEVKEKDLRVFDINYEIKENALRDEITRLKKEIELLNPIDFTSVEKESELKKQYEEKKSVYEDVLTSKRELEKYVKELDKTIKETFEKTFEKLKENFQKIFVEIFGAGEATLEKIFDETNEVKGVEISVRLPFKRKQPLSVLSGGEKSLVALAFLFAIFEINPSPFYVLDEVDAALDDENVYKFGKLLETFSQKSQFIVITHNKQTMEKGEFLYGVTMEEDGISKVVSLKLV